MTEINPRQLILKLLQSRPNRTLSAQAAVTAAAVLGLSENSVRVALVRLQAAELVEPAGRGEYRLGPNASALAAEVSAWRTIERRLGAWDGSWVAAYAGGLGRSDRAALRAREQAFAMLGMRTLEPELWLRPNNLRGGAAEVRTRLQGLGLTHDVAVFRLEDLDAERSERARQLWNGQALDQHYHDTRVELEAWLAKAERLQLDVGARESFLLGDAAIRSLVFDPLLPAPLVDAKARRAFVSTVQRFDRAGHEIWKRFLSASVNDQVTARAI
jgi:phenylacetic acid degradation operon negative regulatory protein